MKYWVAIFLLMAGTAGAAPDTSPRPVGRASGDIAVEALRSIARQPRAESEITAEARSNVTTRSRRPELRPREFRHVARSQDKLHQRGAMCGGVDIQGEHVGQVQGKIRGCGIEGAVGLTAVSGISLSQKAVIDCTTAKALKNWLDTTAKPAFLNSGGGLKSIKVAAHYWCRTRNNRPGARISEHGKGRAIDISGFRLQDGTLITVQNGWRGKHTGPILRQVHSGACGPFGTVLGPESDRYHQDHFHFDTARYRNGPYCR